MTQVGERWACIFDCIACLFKCKAIKETNQQSVKHSNKNKKMVIVIESMYKHTII
jgi:hypothetical protein